MDNERGKVSRGTGGAFSADRISVEFVHVPEGRSVTIQRPWVQIRYGEIVSEDDETVAAEQGGLWLHDGQLYTDFICSVSSSDSGAAR